jgi:hypothetical protein
MRLRGNLISLISVIFILLVSMVMTGCATLSVEYIPDASADRHINTSEAKKIIQRNKFVKNITSEGILFTGGIVQDQPRKFRNEKYFTYEKLQPQLVRFKDPVYEFYQVNLNDNNLLRGGGFSGVFSIKQTDDAKRFVDAIFVLKHAALQSKKISKITARPIPVEKQVLVRSDVDDLHVEKDSSVFIYYSGHGAPNPKTGDAFLVPYDGDPSFIEETGYPLKRLYSKLDRLSVKEIIVVLDSCFSGAGGRSVIAKGARPLVMNMDKQVFHTDRIAILSASSGGQISSTYEEKGHGLFTYFFLKGIKDGNTELGTLYNYLKPQVERIARKTYNNEQTPGLIAPKGLLNLRLYD